jgi:hypothetical protein
MLDHSREYSVPRVARISISPSVDSLFLPPILKTQAHLVQPSMPKSKPTHPNGQSSVIPRIERLLTNQTSVILQAVDEKLSAQDQRIESRFAALDQHLEGRLVAQDIRILAAVDRRLEKMEVSQLGTTARLENRQIPVPVLMWGNWNSVVAFVGRRMKFGCAYSTSARLDSRAARSTVSLWRSTVSGSWRGETARASRGRRQFCSSFSVIDCCRRRLRNRSPHPEIIPGQKSACRKSHHIDTLVLIEI